VQQPAEAMWFVQTAGRVWGPYPQARIEAFAAEGRVTASTALASHVEGPFAPAGEHRELRGLFRAATPEPAPHRSSAPARPLVVWADLTSLSPERFETVLAAYGAYGPKKLYGKEVVGVIRSTFVVDAEGRIEKAAYNVKATGHVAKLRRDLGLG